MSDLFMSLKASGFTSDVLSEVKRARKRFPTSKHLFAALVEEVGEVAHELTFEKLSDNYYTELVQVAAMALRLATEGDPEPDRALAEIASALGDLAQAKQDDPAQVEGHYAYLTHCVYRNEWAHRNQTNPHNGAAMMTARKD